MLVHSKCEPSYLKVGALHRDTRAKDKIENFLKMAAMILIKFQLLMGTIFLNKAAEVVSSGK
jgi:hypothetical protein